MASKIKTGVSETTLSKSSPGSLRVPKLSRITTRSEPNTPSPTQQHSRLSLDRSSANSKPSSEKRSLKIPTPPENLNLGEAGIEARRKAEEDFEIEKFEAVEAGIEAVQRKEEEMKKEIENVKNNHASEASSALLVATQELERVSQELLAANDAKRKIQSEADDATKMAAIHAEKVDILSSELIRLKALLDSTREKEND